MVEIMLFLNILMPFPYLFVYFDSYLWIIWSTISNNWRQWCIYERKLGQKQIIKK